MSAIARSIETGELIRQRAIYGNAKERDSAHEHHERHMMEVERHAEHYLRTLMKWIALLQMSAVITIIGWYAHETGISFYESLHWIVSQGADVWIEVCKQYGEEDRKESLCSK